MSDLKPGDFIAGEYRIRRVFGGQGKSGMGVVYLVEGRTSEMPFVLKTFQSKRASSSSLARFKAEAETWLNIGKHNNTVQCHWVREFSDQLFVAAEYIWPDKAGRNTLTHYLESGGLQLSQQLHWIAHFCFGMKHAMAQGMRAHRDIKPDNLMVDTQGRLKITDFGLAKGLSLVKASNSPTQDETADDGLTVAGSAFGTPPFMSPEQFIDSSSVDERADIYSLGVVIYMMISGGRMPIMPARRGDDYFRQWEQAHRQQRIARLEHPLMPIADKCLEKDASRRFQSYDQLLEAVGEVCRRHGVATPRDEQVARADFERQWSIAMSLRHLGRADEAITKLDQMAQRWPDSSEVYTELGAVYSQLWKLQEALKATEKSLALDQYSTAAWNNLGGILANLERPAEAKSAYRKSLEVEPENTGAMIGLIQLLMAEAELDEAKKWSELAVFWRPEKANVLAIASTCFMKCGDARRAAELLEKLLHMPTDSNGLISGFNPHTSWFNLALCRQTMGEVEGCIHAFREALKRDPKDAKALGFLAQTLVQVGRVDEALPLLDKSLAYDPQFYPAWLAKGHALAKLGQYKEALVCFQQAHNFGDPNAARYVEQCRRRLQPEEPTSTATGDSIGEARNWFAKAAALAKSGEHTVAVSCYEKGLKLQPRNAAAWFNMGHCMGLLGRHQDVVRCCDRALEIDPKDSQHWLLRGLGLYSMESYQDAIASFQQAEKFGDASAADHIAECRRKLSPKAELYFVTGSGYQQEGRNADAIACYEKGLAINPNNGVIWSNLGAALLALKRGAEAVVCFDRAIALDPHDASAWNNKGCALLALGQQSEGWACIQQAKRLRA